MKYVFIRAHQNKFGVRAMFRVLRVHFSGFYAWLKEPLSLRTQDDARQTALIGQAWSDSGKVYGYRTPPTTDLALQALLAPVWRRKPKTKVMIHSDQGSQFTSRKWQVFLTQQDLDASMSRRCNCHDNAIAESFFHLLKRERIRRRTYPSRETARQDMFDYIEMF